MLAGSDDLSSPLPVLVISYIFPPVGEVGAKRIASFCRHFPAAGIRPVVLTAKEKYYRYPDKSSLPPAGIELVRTEVSRTPLDFYRQWKTRTAVPVGSAPVNGEASAKEPGLLQRNIIALLQTPDPYWGWYFPAVAAGKQLLERERFSAIFSSGPPWISHLVARALKLYSGVPWLADFRDPWSYDPYFRKEQPRWKDWIARKLEARCVQEADRIVCNTDPLRQLYTELYPERKAADFLTLTNGFEDATPPPGIETSERRKVFLHVGWLYAQRRVDTFCEAIALLVARGKLLKGTFEVVFLGSADPKIVEDALKKTPSLFKDGSIRFEPPVNWQEAQRRIWSADCLLAFQGSLRLEVPAKLFEYVPTGKPIFAVVKPGALSDLLDQTGIGSWADPDDSEKIAERFLEVLRQPARSPEEVQQRWSGQLHFRSLTARLAEQICELSS